MKKKIIVIFSVFLFLTANAQEISQQDIQRFSAYYSNGMEYLKNQQYSSAIVEFKKVLRFSPYDDTIREALANTYLARAQYYRTTTKEITKALVDLKSAVFYAKYWSETAPSQAMLSLSNSAIKDIADFERRLNVIVTPNGRFDTARKLKAQGELAAAGYDFQNMINSGFKKQALENLGNIYKNLNNLSMAMSYYKDAIDEDPKNPKLHFMYGVMLDEAKNFEASMDEYNLALKYGDKSPELLEILENKWTQNIVNNPSDAQSYNNLGAIYQKQGNFDLAKAQYLKAESLDSKDETSLYNLASLYSEQKNYNAVIGVYDKLLAKKPDNIEVMEYRASALKESGRYEEAMKQYDALIALKPENSNYKAMKNDILYNNFSAQKLQNYLYNRAISSANSYEAQFEYALELHKAKNYNSAIQYYKKAQNINPAKPEPYINLAQIYIEQKNYSAANQICEKGLLILPDNQELKKYLNDSKSFASNDIYENATKLFNEKKYKEAIKEYSKIQNKTKEVDMAIASCWWQLNDFGNANKYYKLVLDENPNDKDALLNSAWAYYNLKDINNAKIAAEKLLLLDKNNKDAAELLGTIKENESSNLLEEAIANYEKQDYNASLNLVNKYLQTKPDDIYGLYYKGLNLDGLGKKSDAIKVYKSVISKKSDFKDVYYSLGFLLDEQEDYKTAVLNYEKYLSLNNGTKDEISDFVTGRVKELKDYLNALNKK